MKSLLLLWKKIANESAIRCCTSATLDYKIVERRVEHEGLSFLTITLPQFGKDFEKSLDQGVVDRSLFQGFTWRGGLPRFLGGFLDHVFDRNGGELLNQPNIDAILAIRQLTLMYGKLLLPCSDARERKSMSDYIECEKDIRINDSSLSESDISDFRRMASMLFTDAFTYVDRKIHDGECVPKHGPGKTADKLLGNKKFRQSTWPLRLEKIFSSSDFLIPNYSFWEQLQDDVDILEPGSEIPVKVVSVPKTLKTPRIIGIEPTAMQYAQQAVLPILLLGLKQDDFLRSALGFSDQTPNQNLAFEGSLSGTLATLDLSEASDRVSNQRVRDLLRYHPHLHAAVDASRSRKADVPGFGVQRLAKFASMGSALCFPFEAMVFLTMIMIGIERAHNSPLSRKDLFNLIGKVRVYGDDIIVPVEYVHSVVKVMTTFGSKINLSKSFWTGKFRESCGKEYYDGNDVSIVRVRRIFPGHRKDATEVISLVSLRNQLYFAGYWSTCQWLDEKVRKIIKYFPVVLPTSPVLGRHSFLGYESQRMCEHLHRPLVKGYVTHTVIPKNSLDDYGALLKYFLKPGDLPFADGDHLERSGRPQAVNIKLRWGSAT